MRRVVPVLLVLIVAAPEAALAGQWYRCRHSGETRAVCCCGDEAHEDSGPPRSEIRRAPCCDILRNQPCAVTARAEPRIDVRVPTPHVTIVLAPALAIDVASGLVPAPAERAMAPPRPTEPLFIRHSALLL